MFCTVLVDFGHNCLKRGGFHRFYRFSGSPIPRYPEIQVFGTPKPRFLSHFGTPLLDPLVSTLAKHIVYRPLINSEPATYLFPRHQKPHPWVYSPIARYRPKKRPFLDQKRSFFGIFRKICVRLTDAFFRSRRESSIVEQGKVVAYCGSPRARARQTGFLDPFLGVVFDPFFTVVKNILDSVCVLDIFGR